MISEKTVPWGKKKAKSFVKLSRCAGVIEASAEREFRAPQAARFFAESAGEIPSPARDSAVEPVCGGAERAIEPQRW
jgi:predicted alternative tryptophan synthase beta-subunit